MSPNLEPAAACMAAAALAWPSLAASPARGAVRFVAVVMLIKGALVPTFVFSLFNTAGLAVGALSESQFLLEALVLGAASLAGWRATLRAASSPLVARRPAW